ncbi:hypothetical protein [Salinisphaera hydrothermalis]|uniref:hypothetical protein n=1 Tax=Salinisphaera hydrothermalis TaxID=563188 RepID=UPI00333ED4C8
MRFNPDYWLGQCLDDFVAFKTLNDLVGDDTAIDSHLSSLVVISADGTSVPAEHAEQIRNHQITGVKNLIRHFGGLTIVGLCTSFEVAVREFYEAWFFRYPSQLHEFVEHKSIKGTVPLAEVLRSDSKESLIKELAVKAASNASQGKYSKILIRASTLSKFEFPNDLQDRISSIQEDRNNTVHEKLPHSGGIKEISEAYDIVSEAIMFLADVAYKSGVPGAYSCLNPVEMVLTDMHFQSVSDA